MLIKVFIQHEFLVCATKNESWNRTKSLYIKPSPQSVKVIMACRISGFNKLPEATMPSILLTCRGRENGPHFPDDIFKCTFLNENISVAIKISLKFVPNGPINNIPALVQMMAWRRPGAKPSSEPMMVRLPTHNCVTRPQWVKQSSETKSMHWDRVTYIHSRTGPSLV